MNIAQEEQRKYHDRLVGLPEDEVRLILNKEGLYSRTIKRDGFFFVVTSDYKPWRANLTITAGIITEVTWG